MIAVTHLGERAPSYRVTLLRLAAVAHGLVPASVVRFAPGDSLLDRLDWLASNPVARCRRRRAATVLASLVTIVCLLPTERLTAGASRRVATKSPVASEATIVGGQLGAAGSGASNDPEHELRERALETVRRALTGHREGCQNLRHAAMWLASDETARAAAGLD